MGHRTMRRACDKKHKEARQLAQAQPEKIKNGKRHSKKKRRTQVIVEIIEVENAHAD